MRIERTMRVRDVVRTLPGSPRVFSDFHIDYCCGGDVTLGEICRRSGLDFDELVQALETTQLWAEHDATRDGFDPATASGAELIGRLLDRHHVSARQSMATIGALLPRVIAAHRERHPELERVASLFEALRRDFEPHMQSEETHAFPAIIAAERGFRDRHGLGHAIRVLEVEHELVDTLVHEIRAAAQGFRPPDDACATYKALYQELAAFESDLIDHVSLENNFLLPLAQSLLPRA